MDIRYQAARAIWLAAAAFALLTSHAAAVIILSFVPAQSVCHVTLQGLPSGITAELNPSSINLVGQINLRDSADNTSDTGVVTWQSATANSRPDEITAVLSAAMGGVPLATITVMQPVLEISGGEFQPSPDGTFTVTPSQLVLRASSLTGSFLGSNLNEADVTVSAPQGALPAVSGQLTRRMSQYRLTLQASVSVPVSSVLADSGASASAISAAADARVLVEVRALAVGTSA
ncbi:hypothetical protein CLOM_g12169 [Closterium sp. NIES-68]|nr:hypothetical protein CLOM_g12169 [Closterium sp. NIES-68]GJP77313.1 hypothetical protein CLOP_g7726 [Closterium sp. NIES-67]